MGCRLEKLGKRRKQRNGRDGRGKPPNHKFLVMAFANTKLAKYTAT